MSKTVQLIVALSAAGCCCLPQSHVLKSGQTLCDQGSIMGPCPGTPAGQDGSSLKGVARSYTDNGDATITDNQTGLIWEKLDAAGGIHDQGNTYDWYEAFTKKIATLNSTNFAGHNDWRLPNAIELHSLIDYGQLNPAVDPIFNKNCVANCTAVSCSCTRSSLPPALAHAACWTSTTLQSDPKLAWYVRFVDGYLSWDIKTGSIFSKWGVRAVRAGS